MTQLDDASLDLLFRSARTANGYTDQPVPMAVLQQVYDLAKMGPTSMNTQPARYVFLTTEAAKARLVPSLMPGNVPKVQTAPVTVIVARDTRFHEHMGDIWHMPGADAMFAGNAALAQATAVRNTTLSGAYFMLAARALGLNCGPMSGFDGAKVNAEFFADGRFEVDFICGLGYADRSKEFPRNKRLSFEQVSTVL